MVKTKRQYILATFFLSGAAAILSLVSLGTQQWVAADVAAPVDPGDTPFRGDYVYFGLFTGSFDQEYIRTVKIPLTMACRFDLNICALLCGENVGDNLEKLYNGDDNSTQVDAECSPISSSSKISSVNEGRSGYSSSSDRIFINTGVWICTIIFLIISAVMGLISAVLAVWNTANNPYQVMCSTFGLYIYNGVAFFMVLLSIVLWGAMFAKDLVTNIPCYKTFLEGFSTEDNAHLGYSYWILLVSLFFYLASICLLYLREYLISKEPEVNVHIEDTADPVIYLY